MNDTVGTDPLDQTVFAALDQAPYALSIGELSRRVHETEPVVTRALERLVAAGRVKMTADAKTRAYYTKVEHLR
jgi:DNA-binding MarR family transcriptional regulator